MKVNLRTVLFGLITTLAIPQAQAMRWYSPSTASWFSRDPAGESTGGANLYGFVKNDPVNRVDAFGLWSTKVHHRIVDDWLSPTPYESYPWHCCTINVRRQIKHGSDTVDGVFWCGFPTIGWFAAQSPKNAYRHAMRNGDTGQSVEEAQGLYWRFVDQHVNQALRISNEARAHKSCALIKLALRELGEAYHSYSDSLSPVHEGFQPWYSPGALGGILPWIQFAQDHAAHEGTDQYLERWGEVNSKISGFFDGYLDSILAE